MSEAPTEPGALLGGPLCGLVADVILMADVFLPREIFQEYDWNKDENCGLVGYFLTETFDSKGRLIWRWFDNRKSTPENHNSTP